MAFERLQVVVEGVVQGVGFRPHVYHVAKQLGLTGWVKNTATGVMIEIQGASASLFEEEIKSKLPPLANITAFNAKPIPSVTTDNQFKIIASEMGAGCSIISPDTAICRHCLDELFNTQSRYYYYPFLNCTHCGPRLTITQKLPYDRCRTAMASFPLCKACEKDYTNPENRRYHAEPTACNECGPQFSSSIDEMVHLIRAGKILAVKGMGGYQLICDGRNEKTILELRRRKNRPAKPFALMAINPDSAGQYIKLSSQESRLLQSQARPVVLVTKGTMSLPYAIAPGLNQLGMMLPFTPAHYLLFHALVGKPDSPRWWEDTYPDVLLVTSANLSGNPLYIDDDMAHDELSQVADKIVSYDRKIITRVDDSVMNVVNKRPGFVRRARGFVPGCIKLPFAIPPTLALGGHLKNTFCMTRGDEAFVSQHIGDMTNKDTIDFFHESLAHLQAFLGVKIERLACDGHPDFYTTQLATEYNVPYFPIQHHHAHLASVAAEHHIVKPALGLALDGYGYGHGGESWGGELLLLNDSGFSRLSHFYPLFLPGGDIAVQEPWRMASVVLQSLGKEDDMMRLFSSMPQALPFFNWLECAPQRAKTTSCGRLFDAASALLGINLMSQYEGQAAQLLESRVTKPQVVTAGWDVTQGCFNLLPLFEQLLNVNPETGANRFHGTLIAGLTEWVLLWSAQTSIKTVLLSGGCFLNKILAEGLTKELTRLGFEVYLPEKLPPNDGGLSLGQAWVAGQMA